MATGLSTRVSWTHVCNIGGGRGWYHDAELSRHLALHRRFGLQMTAGAGLSQHLWMNQTTFSDIRARAKAVLASRGGLQFRPYYEASMGHRSLFGHHHTFGITIAIAGER